MTQPATVPAPNASRPSGTFISQPPKLALLAMALGIAPAEAIQLAAARTAEAARLSSFEAATR